MIRVGSSFDIHRLMIGDGLILGGVKIPCEFKAVAHSDGDCVLHALSEAIFSALGLEDLGTYFPDSDHGTAGLDSCVILEESLKRLKEKDKSLVHVAVHILLERPKLKTYKTAIKDNLKELLGLSEEEIAVHAGTMEGLGPIGQQQAVATFATVTISDSK